MDPVQSEGVGPLVRAAQYVRMSRDHQNYSIEHQSAANADYARRRGIEIVRTYTDDGISGVRIDKRDGLKQLLADVVAGRADFALVLVYDVSRWGRFQDPDESAHYEFLCKLAGVRVAYCAEPFENDGSFLSTFAKHMKRQMAGEFSRDLSVKVSQAQRRLALKGLWMGGPPGYGFRRCVLPYLGRPARVLERGERNGLRGARMVLVEGPPDEVETVRRIYRMFVEQAQSVREITATLNMEGVRRCDGGTWTPCAVRRILSEETYAGTLLIGRRETHLNETIHRRRSEFLRVPGACPALVDRTTFNAARAAMRKSSPVGSDEELIEELRGVLRRRGRLSFNVIEHDREAHSASVYIRRFGGLAEAYERVGYTPTAKQRAASLACQRYGPHLHRLRQIPDERMLDDLRALLADHGALSAELINSRSDLPAHSTYVRRFGSMANIYRVLGYQPTARQAAVLAAKVRQRALRMVNPDSSSPTS